MGRTLAALPALTLLAMLGPVAAGLAGTLLPAIGLMPGGGGTLSLEPVRDLLAWPGLADAARLSLTTGLLATAASLCIVALITAGWAGTRPFRLLERLLSPLLAVPHAAAAFGLAFLIAPSGWVARMVSPWATGWERPPDLLIVQDVWGLSLAAGLIAKEVPFLLLMTLAALGQSDSTRSLRVAQSLGYGRVSGWLKAVFPRVYAQIRLPVYVVLAYSMTVVDMALILGPTSPPPLSVQIVRWANDPDITLRSTAAAGALFQLALVLAALAVWRLGEAVAGRLGQAWAARGGRGRADLALRPLALGLGALSGLAVLAGLASLAIWSAAGFWSFPNALPDSFGWRTWQRHGPDIAASAATTAAVAIIATTLALALTIGCLEAEHRTQRRITPRGLWLLYLPLLIPQVAFLPGLQTLLLLSGAPAGMAPVIAAHLVFVLPYVFLSLGDPWRAWDPRVARVAAALGTSPMRILWQLRLPMLLRPVLTAAAVGLAVSVGQYLPTLLIGGGRVATLTTEAVATAAGGDRRAIGAYGISQTVAALVPFALALAMPALVFRNRRGLHG